MTCCGCGKEIKDGQTYAVAESAFFFMVNAVPTPHRQEMRNDNN